MTPRRPHRSIAKSALWALVILSAPALAAAADKITIEDMLNAEEIDGQYSGAGFAPDGTAAVFTVNAAPTTRPTWGYETASLQTMARIFVTEGGGAPQEIQSTKDTLYSAVAVDPWSPDSKGLLLVATQRDAYGFAYFDRASRKITAIPGRIDNAFVPTFAWTSDNRIIFATVPDGERQRRADGQMLSELNERWSRIWTEGAAQVTVHSTLPVFASTAPAPGALVLADPRTGTSKKIAAGTYLAVHTAPTGRYVAAVSSGELLVDALSFYGHRGQLEIVAIDGGSAKVVHRFTDMDAAITDGMAWSPSGKTLLVAARPKGAKAGETRLYTIDAQSGRRTEVAGSSGLTFEKISPDIGMFPLGWLGEKPVAIAAHPVEGAQGMTMEGLAGTTTYEYGQARRGLRADLFVFDGGKAENLTTFAKTSIRDFVVTDTGSLLVVSEGALWKAVPGKAAEKVTPAGSPPIIGFGVDRRNPPPVGQTTYYHKGDVERVGLYTIAGQDMKRVTVDLETGAVTPLDVNGDVVISAPDRRTVLVKRDDGWVTSLAYNDGSERPLMTVNANLKDKAIGEVEKFTYKVGERQLNGFVLWPPNAKKGTKLPAVVSVYGGTVYGEQPPGFSKAGVGTPVFSGQLLAAEGYAVIYPSTPLGAGADGDQPSGLADAVIAAVDAAAAGGRIDVKHVGVMGQSFGGFSTASLLGKRSDRLAAGISLAGLYDFQHAYGKRDMATVFSDEPIITGYARFIEQGQGQLGAPFWRAKEAYIRNSPIYLADTLDSPLLMLHGDLDLGATDLAGAERMYASLLRANKKPVLIHYWGEGHVAQSAAAQRDQWSRITTWFDYYLKQGKK